MAVTLIPYGQLADGKYGVKLDDGTGAPIVTALEVLNALPVTDLSEGRLVYVKDPDNTLYVYQEGTINDWFPLEGIPAEVGAVAGSPPTVPTPIQGFLFFDTDTEVMFVWDGTVWQPIGGRFAARYIEQINISNGAAGPGGDTFSLGVVPVFAEFVEVFLDGIRQLPNPGGDYNVIGNNVVFPAPVPLNVEVYTRTLQSTVLETPAILANTQVSEVKETSILNQTTFDAGQPGLDPAGTFVFLNGVLQCGGGIDYIHSTADTVISSITQVAGVATVTTPGNNFAAIGFEVTIFGAAEADYNGTVIITGTPFPNQFEYAINPAAPASATADPVLFYDPPFTNDNIIFTTPLPAGELVTIRALQSLTTAPTQGQANTGANLGSGEPVFAGMSSEVLTFNSLAAGPNITLFNGGGGEIQISTTAGATSEGYVETGVSPYVLGSTESYIGVNTSVGVIIIDVSTAAVNPDIGRRVVITDQTGDAGANPINITHTARLFNGAPSPLLVDVDFGSVTIVFDGVNWHITSKTF